MLQHLKELLTPKAAKILDLQNVELIDIDKGSSDEIPKADDQSNPKQHHLVMEDEMVHLCRGLSDSTQGFDHLIDTWLSELDAYLSKYDRLLYSTITNFIYGLNEEEYAIFEVNLYYVFEEVMNRPLPEKADDARAAALRRRHVLKFYDHVNLARRQSTLYSDKKNNLEEMIAAQIEPKLAASAKDLTSQLIGMVAIFTALSFIVFGGISSLESLFAKLPCNTDTVLPVIIVALAWTLCIGNLLFAFMYFVLHVIGVKPDLSAEKGNPIQRYPLVFFTNYVLGSGLLVFSAAMYAKVHGIGKGIYTFVLSHNDWVFFIALAFIVGVIFATGRFLLRLYKKTNPIDNV